MNNEEEKGPETKKRGRATQTSVGRTDLLSRMVRWMANTAKVTKRFAMDAKVLQSWEMLSRKSAKPQLRTAATPASTKNVASKWSTWLSCNRKKRMNTMMMHG